MEKILLKAEKRTELGKGSVRALRRHGMLPAILYSKGDSTPIKLHGKEMRVLMMSGRGEHTLFNIEFSGDKSKEKAHWAIIKDYQIDPMKNELLHVDFMEISLKEKIKMTLPIVITKEPIGIKKGGILQQQMREIEIECLPTEIPDGIEVDASSVDIGHSLHVSDLVVKEGIKILSDPKDAVLTVNAPVVEEVAPVVEKITEPELIRKAKPKEEEEVAEEQQKGQKEQKTQKEKD